MSELINLEEKLEEKDNIATDEEIRVLTPEEKLTALQGQITGMSGEDILNLDKEKTAEITKGIKTIVSDVFVSMRDKASEKLTTVKAMEDTIINACTIALSVVNGHAKFEEVEALLESNKDIIETVIGKGAVLDIRNNLHNATTYDPNNMIGKYNAIQKIETIITKHQARKDTLGLSYIDTADFAMFLEEDFEECRSIATDLRKYNLFKAKLTKFLKKKVSKTKEALAFHANYNGKFIPPAADRFSKAYMNLADKDTPVGEQDLGLAVSICTMAIFRYMFKLFNDNTLVDFQRKRIISGIFVDTPELEAMKYAAVKACMDRLHEEYLVWRKLNNIPDELEASNDDDSMLQEGAANVFANTEEAATFIEENKPE